MYFSSSPFEKAFLAANRGNKREFYNNLYLSSTTYHLPIRNHNKSPSPPLLKGEFNRQNSLGSAIENKREPYY